jgi:ribosomal RNA-processing protein 36
MSAPEETSAKIKPKRFRQVVPLKPTPKRRDPRFDDQSGDFKPELFERSYGFMFEQREKDISELEKQQAKQKDPDEKSRMKKALQILVWLPGVFADRTVIDAAAERQASTTQTR